MSKDVHTAHGAWYLATTKIIPENGHVRSWKYDDQRQEVRQPLATNTPRSAAPVPSTLSEEGLVPNVSTVLLTEAVCLQEHSNMMRDINSEIHAWRRLELKYDRECKM